MRAFDEGFVAGQGVRERGVSKAAMITGRFVPFSERQRRPPHGAGWGTFYVMRGSLPVFEQQMAHEDVLDFWRGFVQAFDL